MAVVKMNDAEIKNGNFFVNKITISVYLVKKVICTLHSSGHGHIGNGGVDRGGDRGCWNGN